MRRWSVLCAILIASTHITADEVPDWSNETVTKNVSVSVPGPVNASLAIQHVVMQIFEMAEIPAVIRPAPDECNVPENLTCTDAMLKTLVTDYVEVAIVSISADNTPADWKMHDRGIYELGEITAPSRRACLATKPPARSLMDLTNLSVAANYNIPDYELKLLNEKNYQTDCKPKWCNDIQCATLLTSRKNEMKLLCEEIQKHHLYATVIPLGENVADYVTSEFSERPIIVCDWAPEMTSLANLKAETLGPPPCIERPCLFETRRTVTYIEKRKMSTSCKGVVTALSKLNIKVEEMRTLTADTNTKGPAEAARIYMKNHPLDKGEVQIAVLIPITTGRDGYNSHELMAAAVLAEKDIEAEKNSETATARFKVSIKDDKCTSNGVSDSLNGDLSGGHFESLSAVAGPVCGAPWSYAVHSHTPYNLPQLAYTPQVPIRTEDAGDNKVEVDKEGMRLQMLGAGDAREAASAISALVKILGWSRVAALYEPATRLLQEPMSNVVEFVVNKELPEDSYNVSLIQTWASKAANANARIIYLCVEDSRLARAALCAARAHGLTPSAGAVWLMCNTHKPGWLRANPGELDCTTEQLEKEAEGHFTVTADWALSWQKSSANASEQRRDWERRWRKECENMNWNCKEAPGPDAALLYDLIRNWAHAVFGLLAKNQFANSELQMPHHVSFMINNATRANYTGLTGLIKWKPVKHAYVRDISIVLSQWDSKLGARPIGNWSEGSLKLNRAAIRWYSSDGRMPDDGSEICTLQGLANFLNSDCRTAFVALCTMLVAILIASVSGIAWHCKRRAEKEYRKRLQALGMRPLAIKPAGLDRWEVPRERVVINRKLGTGAFGTVYGGHALLAEDRGWSAVAVKTLKAGATTEEKLDFLSEAEAMKRFDHKNVVRLLGVVTKTEPVCTVMEFMLYGDLKNYLLARRHIAMGGGMEDSEGLEVDEASPRRLTGMALDVARALSYLAQLRYVHRDVAARNCLVSARRVVKLADFGMTRLVFENDYYRFSRKGMLPVRWMAPESLALGVFSPASDVWSFGVLLYEIATFGSLPFQGLSNSEVLTRVKGGHTLDLPQGLKPQLEGLIKSCWQQDPKKRPTASEVAAFLADAPRLLSPCLDLPLDALSLDADPPLRLPRDQAEARWVSWAAPASATTDTTYLSADGPVPLDTDSFLP